MKSFDPHDDPLLAVVRGIMVTLAPPGPDDKGAQMLNLQELRAQLGADNKATRDSELKSARRGFEKRKDLTKVLAIAAACDAAGLVEGKWEDGWRIFASGGWAIYVNINVEGFLEAHDQRLANLLAAISAACPGTEWSSHDDPTNKTRRFTIWGADLHLDVTAELKDDSQKCRRVVVGKRTVEQELYEFRCDGEEVSS